MTRLLKLALLWLAAACGLAQAAFAHEIRPAYLQIREIEPGVYDLLWKTPAQGDMRLALNVALPEACVDAAEPRATMVDGAVIERWRTTCQGGIVGKTIGIENLSQTLTDAIVRFEPLDGLAKTLRVTPDNPEFAIPEKQAWTEVAQTYFGLGVEHILFGADHLLFVLGLLLIVRGRWMLVKTITAFTVAHSITLAAATLGVVQVPAPPLNAAIALSILCLGVEVARSWRGRTSLALRHPWLLAFAFGLLHGLGYASGLLALGLPPADIPLALLLFNLGVEAGQLLFVALILLLERAFRLLEIDWPRPVRFLPVYVVGTLGAYWTIDRVVAMLGSTG